MPRTPLSFETGPLRSTKFERSVDDAVVAFAEENTGGNLAEAIRLLVTQAVGARGGLNGLGRSMEQAGYHAARRQLLSELRAAASKAINETWRDDE